MFKQSLAYWCLNASEWKWDVERICTVARELHYDSVELVPPELWDAVKSHGLQNALAHNGMPDPVFARGLNDPRNHEEVIACTRREIARCADYGVPNVIAFTGYKSGSTPFDTSGAEHTIQGLRTLAADAEKHGVTVVLEHLNTRDTSHPMKGHPGYEGDDIDVCAEIVRRAGSPRVKLLFDVYHVAIMHGDVIRRLHQYRDLIGHIHVAGVPGRAELDDRQEINYRAIAHALVDIGYEGYVGMEFLPTRDPRQGLAEAHEVFTI